MRWLALPLLVAGLAACGTAPKKPSQPLGQGSKTMPSPGQGSTTGSTKKCARVYAPAQEDPSKRGDYKAGGLYAPGVSDTTPDYVPDVDCITEPAVTNEPRSPVGNRSPYTVLGKQYRVMDRVDGYVERGTASYYGAKFHGRRTSNQEVYDMYAFTAAHKSLPLPSFARVTNLDNGRSVVVRVNDRGPFHEGRVIDLSYAAAVKLGITQRGTGRVEVRALKPGDTGTLTASQSPSAIPAAKDSAMDQLVSALPKSASPRSAPAAEVALTATSQRYHVTPDAQGSPSADSFDAWMRARGVRVATGKPGVPATVAATATAAPGKSPAKGASARAAAPAAAVATAAPSSSPSVQLQVASFASRENADRAVAQLAAAGIGGATVSDVDSKGRKLWRLRVGAPDLSAAAELAGRIAGLGFERPQVVRE
ncbi:septal ring lytic transglycosylase RlpA family protein [Pseudoxanthomonas sp. UTMC 1351]|uniref:septal ring lytic transglycosylase RlpA family protein n=1 Tax=Pseudoxanthomonas sp. UTMC 1351 TaxID=2695853 RepID=UPI0034CD79CB